MLRYFPVPVHIPIYSGSRDEDVVEWMSNFQLTAKIIGWSNVEMFQYLPAYLSGTARRWYEYTFDETYSGTKPPKDFNELRSKLIKDNCPTDYRDYLARKLKKIEQKPDQPVAEFIFEVKSLCNRIEEQMSEKSIVSLIIGGLLPDITKEVVKANPSTISEVLDIARSVERGIISQTENSKVNIMSTLLTMVKELKNEINKLKAEEKKQCKFCQRTGHEVGECQKRRHKISPFMHLEMKYYPSFPNLVNQQPFYPMSSYPQQQQFATQQTQQQFIIQPSQHQFDVQHEDQYLTARRSKKRETDPMNTKEENNLTKFDSMQQLQGFSQAIVNNLVELEPEDTSGYSTASNQSTTPMDLNSPETIVKKESFRNDCNRYIIIDGSQSSLNSKTIAEKIEDIVQIDEKTSITTNNESFLKDCLSSKERIGFECNSTDYEPYIAPDNVVQPNPLPRSTNDRNSSNNSKNEADSLPDTMIPDIMISLPDMDASLRDSIDQKLINLKNKNRSQRQFEPQKIASRYPNRLNHYHSNCIKYEIPFGKPDNQFYPVYIWEYWRLKPHLYIY